MKGWINRYLRPKPAVSFLPPTPEFPVCVIGDVHGRIDLLNVLLAKLDSALPLVFVGDYVDRGESSADVLRCLSELGEDPRRSVHCLMGNHEDMLLSFLDDPERRGRTWLGNGGLQTLASFGVAGLSDTSAAAAMIAARRLRDAMGDALIGWLRQRPLFWRSGNVAVVHAGADPDLAIEDQPAGNLIWGHRAFRKTPRHDGIWLVHGHSIVDAPAIGNGIISIDTGAYATGHLTAVLLGDGPVRCVAT